MCAEYGGNPMLDLWSRRITLRAWLAKFHGLPPGNALDRARTGSAWAGPESQLLRLLEQRSRELQMVIGHLPALMSGERVQMPEVHLLPLPGDDDYLPPEPVHHDDEPTPEELELSQLSWGEG